VATYQGADLFSCMQVQRAAIPEGGCNEALGASCRHLWPSTAHIPLHQCSMTSTCCSARRLSSIGSCCGAGSLLGDSLLGGDAALASAAAQIAAAGLASPSRCEGCSPLSDGVPGDSGSSGLPAALLNPRSPAAGLCAAARSWRAVSFASCPLVASACRLTNGLPSTLRLLAAPAPVRVADALGTSVFGHAAVVPPVVVQAPIAPPLEAWQHVCVPNR
jgi:hypothetical protein